jgi:uncharacterized membrane protein
MAATPVWELRGAIPAGIFAFDQPWWGVFLVSLLGNIFPIPFIILFLDPVTRFLNRIKFMEKAIRWIFQRAEKRSELVKKYEKVGLMIFVAVPLPGTGAWTGSLIAFMLGMDLKSAFWPIALGVLIAAVIVLTLCLLGWVGAVIAGIVLAVLAAFGLLKF